MNNERRKILDQATAKIEQASTLMEEAKQLLEEVAGDEREAHENMPDSLKEGERGAAMEQAADDLDEAVSSIDQIDFDEILGQIEGARDA